jgi:hypothetical protein
MPNPAVRPSKASIPNARMGLRLGAVAMTGLLAVAGSAVLMRDPAPPAAPEPSPSAIAATAPARPEPDRLAALAAEAAPSADLPSEPLPPPEAPVAETAGEPSPEEPRPAAEPATAMAGPASRLVPLPVPRPPELRSGRVAAAPRLPRPRRAAPQPAAPAEEPSFFERLFGLKPDPGQPAPALSYAALENGAADGAFRRRIVPVPPPPQGAGGVAVYDISARTVTLPNGERLEAHSGLGPMMDDPDHAHVPMRGVTPPGTYDLVERERAFHGVRAIRLNPVGGSAAVHGRTGLLAHTYMLGPSGASNGCVAFRDYDRFLQSYLKGEVSRLVVVSGRG